ncbi:hypothetical protein ACIO7M_32470 [Streptomyces toxytricini]|uniref:Uncharacterized protein n=1 Tax=Streptomyces toxytricini TaxID=67369 RepID=A0ABW8ERB2_STRT5
MGVSRQFVGWDDAFPTVELVLFAGVAEGGSQQGVDEWSESLDLDEDVSDVAIGPRDVVPVGLGCWAADLFAFTQALVCVGEGVQPASQSSKARSSGKPEA